LRDYGLFCHHIDIGHAHHKLIGLGWGLSGGPRKNLGRTQMADEHKSLEMRVAELEDKLNKMSAMPASIPQICVYACYQCYVCYTCIRNCIYECTCGPCIQYSANMGAGGGFGTLGR
jgi:hypothetical protein